MIDGSSRAGSAWVTRAALAILLVATVLLVWERSVEFATLEPRQDQAWFTQWVRAFHETERFWPRQADGESWRAALEADEGSALHILLRQLYAVPFALLNLGAFAWYGLLVGLTGASMPGQVTISILSSSLAIAALSLFAYWLGRSRREALLFATAAFALAAGSSFLRVFSALGPHNVAILMLVLLLWAGERWLALERTGGEAAARRSAGAAVLLLYSLTLFTYHGGTMLAPPVLALAILAEGRLPWTRRAALVAGLVAWTVLLLLPLAVAGWIGAQAGYIGSREQGIAAYIRLAVSGGEDGIGIESLLRWGRLWIDAQTQAFSAPGLLLGVAGLVDLAVRRRCRAPLILALVHVVLGLTIPNFTQYDRTSAYLLPFLALGAAWAVAAPAAALAARRRAVAAGLTVLSAVLLALHARDETPRLREPTRVTAWAYYLQHQGAWTPMQREIEVLVPAGAVLIPWDYQLSHLYGSLRAADGHGPRLYVPLSTLRDRQADGSLTDYLARRRLALEPGAALFVLVPAGEPVSGLVDVLRRIDSGLAELCLVRRWDGQMPSLYRALALYRRCDPR